MKISLINAGKRYNREWVFRNVHYTFTAGSAYAITGSNGSGKSTLLQCLAGALLLSEGTLHYDPSPPVTSNTEAAVAQQATPLPVLENWHEYMALTAPYLELIEEFTPLEFLRFHAQFKPFLKGMHAETIMEEMKLTPHKNKPISLFSSGMKQRLKLAQAIFSDVPVILLDEPCTNLDHDSIKDYQQLIGKYGSDRLVIVSSNEPAEYTFCTHVLQMANFK